MAAMNTLGRVIKEVRADVGAARDRDPAARSVGTFAILSSWGGGPKPPATTASAGRLGRVLPEP